MFPYSPIIITQVTNRLKGGSNGEERDFGRRKPQFLQYLHGVYPRPGRWSTQCPGRPAEPGAGCGLPDSIARDESCASDVVRMEWSFLEAQHGSKADIAAFQHLAPLLP